MNPPSPLKRLADVYDGWQGYQTSLAHAVETLSTEQLRWRPGPRAQSVGEVVRHISLGRVAWFARMDAPGSADVCAAIPEWEVDGDGNKDIVERAVPITDSAAELVKWLELTWRMIETTLTSWTVADLDRTYDHRWNGQVYRVSYQWTVWRILTHDVHHGGELSLTLGAHGLPGLAL